MKNDNDIKIEICSYSAELVAFLYDEMNPSERDMFERHLADCDPCTDEFAELSFARLDVYEWHRDEFVSMETPRFVIPYAVVDTKTSWLDAFRGLFASHGQLAAAGGAFALIAIISGAIYVASMNRADEIASSPGSDSVATNKAKSVNSPSAPQAAKDVVTDPPQSVSAPGMVKVSESGKGAVPAKAVNRRPAKTQERNATRRLTTTPRLNDFEDEDDNTLRLGDLLADIDTRY